jgi:3-deoxy-manno-octulosonate cytidylyltransferase (CMP-KDO synthetase)
VRPRPRLRGAAAGEHKVDFPVRPPATPSSTASAAPVPPTAAARPTAIAVIPARFASTRLPGKPLVDLAGLPMIVRVAEQARRTPGLSGVLVATDDLRVRDAVEAHGHRAVMTREDHRSGTDRLAEVAAGLDCDVIVNVQGDEPLIDPAMIAQALEPFAADPAVEMTTLCRALTDAEEFANPNVVKAVVGRDGFALYFSRAAVPFDRAAAGRAVVPQHAFKHIGLYAYRRSTVLRLAALAPTALEDTEMLEQLRALEHGIRIRVVRTELDSIGVDTEADVARVRALLLAADPAALLDRPVHDHA